ncbi:MAG TPA: 2-phospho-L-lactate transferase, partial [Candidatus Lokiarchaeia archaeon]|nr:2-phospho-L-lactate transferase [Candidatus Lokiarchaeia archaeon]
MKVTALAGGIGAAKLLEGLYAELNEDLTTIVNVGDDDIFFGLNVSPDLDIITYTLAGIIDLERRWGLAGETFNCIKALGTYYPENWFNLGDKDIATHIFRTEQMRQGRTLAEVTQMIGEKLGVSCAILPVTNDIVQTKLHTDVGVLDFEDYFVKHKAEVPVQFIEYQGAPSAVPAPHVLDAIAGADRIIICPSNPMLSIGPILAVPGIREAIAARRSDVIAVTPIIQGDAVKGPTARIFRELGYEVNPLGVVDYYGADLFSEFVADIRDASAVQGIDSNHFQEPVHFATFDTLMSDITKKVELARFLLEIEI